jgi:hypothetical protein
VTRFDGICPPSPAADPPDAQRPIHPRKFAAEYFERFPKDRYQTEVESWRELQSQNIEFTMKRLREPIEPERIGRRRLESRFCGSCATYE